jgi:uncharacterized protein affecting Mg2+/Co2+ transport
VSNTLKRRPKLSGRNDRKKNYGLAFEYRDFPEKAQNRQNPQSDNEPSSFAEPRPFPLSETTPYAIATRARFRFSFIGPDGRRIYVWSYWVIVINAAMHKIRLVGRRWDTNRGNLHEFFPVFGRGFAPSVGGTLPFLESGDPYIYEAAAASFDPPLHSMKGTLDALNYDDGTPLRIDVPAIYFETPNTTPDDTRVGGEGERLNAADATALREVVAEYNAARGLGSALFRSNDRRLSSHGQKIVSCFLIAEEHTNREKRREFDFADILPTNCNISSCVTEESDDHCFLPALKNDDFPFYIAYNHPIMLPNANDGDATFEQFLIDAKNRLGFSTVAKLLFGIASPEERARFMGMIANYLYVPPDSEGVKLLIEAIGTETAREVCDEIDAERPCVNAPSIPATDQEAHDLLSPLAIILDGMSPEQREIELKRHYKIGLEYEGLTDRKTWSEVRSKNPQPKEFLNWLDTHFSDRKKIRLLLSDMKFLDKAAYDKISDWSRSTSDIPAKTIASFGLPSRYQKFDPIVDATAPTSLAQVFSRAENGKESLKKLRRDYGRVRYHL